ncbi:MAG: phosphoribosylanthranilate isomerase [Flavobacteriaceae bacterium]|nr:phosphoribosylanthranilate isomerase [Flavobacteriaceae bacterium]MDG2276023.1 phosphoribosylanthranilate isomerase [Flavobacteriaceae bacterium]|tara:strand:+ start:139 stop:756 length:618 start_codon:yes stop_codon:yes gene_type:complete
MKLKVCGMKYVENIKSIADLNPDYLGFIFYNRSKRNFTGTIPELPKHIKKTGVFVNEEPSIVVSLQEKHQLQAIQLHGDESVAYVQELKRSLSNKIEIIKVVGLKNDAYFEELISYEKEVDYFLFDTKGKERGGNGVKFDWSVLKEYPFSKPFFLSGGIGPNDVQLVKEVKKSGLPIYALDINSKFEDKPGLKNSIKVINFKNQL